MLELEAIPPNFYQITTSNTGSILQWHIRALCIHRHDEQTDRWMHSYRQCKYRAYVWCFMQPADIIVGVSSIDSFRAVLRWFTYIFSEIDRYSLCIVLIRHRMRLITALNIYNISIKKSTVCGDFRSSVFVPKSNKCTTLCFGYVHMSIRSYVHSWYDWVISLRKL